MSIISIINKGKDLTVSHHVDNVFTFEGDIEVSDGYHTMHELYQHRMALNIALFHAIDHIYRHSPLGSSWMHPKVFKSKKHHPEGEPMFEGYFIVFVTVAELNGAWTSYHYKLKHWDEFKIREAPYSPLYPLNHEDAREMFGKLIKFDDRGVEPRTAAGSLD